MIENAVHDAEAPYRLTTLRGRTPIGMLGDGTTGFLTFPLLSSPRLPLPHEFVLVAGDCRL